MKNDYKLTSGMAVVTLLLALVSMNRDRTCWELTEGLVWGGADCTDCVDYESTSWSCITQDEDEEIKCYKHSGENVETGCANEACVPVNNKYQCPHNEFRKYYDGRATRKTVSTGQFRIQACFEETTSSNEEFGEFCDCKGFDGSTKEHKEDIPCFVTESCYTGVDSCLPHPTSGQHMCSQSGTGTSTEEPPDVTPHPNWPCFKAAAAQKLQECKNFYNEKKNDQDNNGSL